jgi:hypothetical protein
VCTFISILPVTTSAEIQPSKGTPGEGSTFEGEEGFEKDTVDELDPEVLKS